MKGSKASTYRDRVSAAMKKRYGITWDDAAGDVEPLETAMRDGMTPDEFVRWFGERYNLIPVNSRGWL